MAIDPRYQTGRMWYGDPVPSATTGVGPLALPIAGTPLSMGPPAPGGGMGPAPAGPMAAPAAPSPTGTGALGQSIVGGLMGFMGGYTGRPGLVASGMNTVLGMQAAEQQRQALQAAQTARESIMSGVDWSNPESIEKGAREAWKAGLNEIGDDMAARADKRRDFLDSRRTEQRELLEEPRKAAESAVQAYRDIKSMMDQYPDIEKAPEAVKVAAVMKFARQMNPEAVNESDFQRYVMQPGVGWREVVDFLGRLPIVPDINLTTPDEAVRDIEALLKTNAETRLDYFETLSKGTGLAYPNYRSLMVRTPPTPVDTTSTWQDLVRGTLKGLGQ